MTARLTCPDGGTCHHECEARCFRVGTCVPLTSFGRDWPEAVKALHAQPPTDLTIQTALATGLGVEYDGHALDPRRITLVRHPPPPPAFARGDRVRLSDFPEGDGVYEVEDVEPDGTLRLRRRS